jgi:hypothetical protein
MRACAVGSAHHHFDFGFSGALRVGKRFLNAMTERASIAADRSQFAALPSRYLDDIGITAAERTAILGYEESTTDGWRVVASHL